MSFELAVVVYHGAHGAERAYAAAGERVRGAPWADEVATDQAAGALEEAVGAVPRAS